MSGPAFARIRAVLIAVAVIAFAIAPSAAAGEPTASASLGKAGDRARDCVGDTFLDKDRPDAIGFVVWCGVQSGKVRFTLQRTEGGRIEGFARSLQTRGRGAGAPFRCRQRGQTLKCVGRKQGPAAIRGWIAAEAGGRCTGRTRLETAGIIHGAPPHGCPGTRPPRPPQGIGSIRGFRELFGLDPDLNGNRAAIDRRIRKLIRAWHRGNPVARYTASNLGVPLRARDQRELEYRDEYLEQTYRELDAWVPLHARDTYAGYDVSHEDGGIVYVGFVGDQDAQLKAFLRSFEPIAPGRIKPFPVPPKYTEAYLEELAEGVWEPPSSKLGELIFSSEINTLANLVEVGTQHVRQVRRLIAEKYGPDAPFRVVFEEPGGLL